MSTDITPTASDASPFDAIKRVDADGSERWSARELMPLMGYSAWRNFLVPIERAVKTVENQGEDSAKHFARSRKVSQSGPDAKDCALTRFAAYLVAMNGDPNKAEVAAAQAYFAIRTREAEVATATPAIPQTYADALRAAADESERADREAKARAEAEGYAKQLEAPASAWTHMASSTGDYLVGDAAKVLSRDPAISIGRDRLFAFMAAEGWVYRGSGRRKAWRAYQTQVDCARLVEKMASPFLNQKTGDMELPEPTVRVTAKGLAELHKRLGGTVALEPLAVAS